MKKTANFFGLKFLFAQMISLGLLFAPPVVALENCSSSLLEDQTISHKLWIQGFATEPLASFSNDYSFTEVELLSLLKGFSIYRTSKNIPRLTCNRKDSKRPLLPRTRLSHTFDDLFFAHKPGSKEIVAVIGLYRGSAGDLNPRHSDIEYGPIPNLDKMSPAVADALWSNSPVKGQILPNPNQMMKSYKLVSTLNNGLEVPQENFHLDVIFIKEQFYQYRLRGKNMRPEWRS